MKVEGWMKNEWYVDEDGMSLRQTMMKLNEMDKWWV